MKFLSMCFLSIECQSPLISFLYSFTQSSNLFFSFFSFLFLFFILLTVFHFTFTFIFFFVLCFWGFCEFFCSFFWFIFFKKRQFFFCFLFEISPLRSFFSFFRENYFELIVLSWRLDSVFLLMNCLWWRFWEFFLWFF